MNKGKRIIILFVIPLVLFLSGCQQAQGKPFEKVGLLLSHPIDDQGWNMKGYQGILKVQSEFDVEVLMKEGVRSEGAVRKSLEEFEEEDVSLVIGHSQLYADLFMKLKGDFPSIHFVSFNGDVEGENITSIHFNGYAMGYFAGMLAGEMTKTNTVGVIAAFPFQPEVEGFEDGVNYQAPEVDVKVDFVESWVEEEAALEIFEGMKNEGADIYYPAGDGFHTAIIEEVKKEGLYAIGYVGDQLDLGVYTVLTSTVQEVEKMYEYVAEKFSKGELETGNKYFGFSDGVISMGEYGKEVPSETISWLNEHVDTYIKTGHLPHELDESNGGGSQ
ncbi:BMP family ABC transporter substrate-binding protein [Salipaludibacillus neizhouensis]|uniref:BMP family ABC transporter substrate-binding protein n=1 Tax=Salipaludibacillus neizhouensis TaxID=885475 RepID=A0A3A9K587_9BACI|nr:BMP family ABC transporter substrate-binding protein [Salipaludibacillus neizhouensis]RKL67747.1 BMP family ABC transporter substrate-binding protein [Salipaludibacillus neizhouensis]